MQSEAPPRETDGRSQGTRRKSGLGFWIRRGLVWMVAVLLALAVIGAIYQTMATRLDEQAYPAPGNLVGVGGHRFHIRCVGQGNPKMIPKSASEGTSAHWAGVQQVVSETTRVCAYDRAGLGGSKRGPEPRDAGQVSGELHDLLPSDVGARIQAEGGLGKTSAEGLRREGEAYVNDAYGDTDVTLEVDVRGGIGEINLEVV